MPSPIRPVPFRHVAALAIVAGLFVPAAALAQQGAEPVRQASTEPALPTVEDILRRATAGQAQRPPAQPDTRVPAAKLPTLGDIAAAAPSAPPKPQTISCEPPKPPAAPPDGKTAGEAEMRKAEQAFRTYVKAGQDFQACLDLAQKEAMRSMTVGEYIALERLYLQMQGAMEIEAAKFNQQLRVFKAR